MNDVDSRDIVVDILGKKYPIKCPANKIQELQDAATHVDKEMRKMSGNGIVVDVNRVAIITAINLAHQLLAVRTGESDNVRNISQRLEIIKEKISTLLTPTEQMLL